MKAPVFAAILLSMLLVLAGTAFLSCRYGISPFCNSGDTMDNNDATEGNSEEISALKARVAELESMINHSDGELSPANSRPLQSLPPDHGADNAGGAFSPPAAGSDSVPDGLPKRQKVSFPSKPRQPAAAGTSQNDGTSSGSRPKSEGKSKRDKLKFVSIDCTHVGKDVIHHPLQVYQCPFCENVFISHCIHTGNIERHNQEWRLTISCKCHKTTGVERLPDESVQKWNALMKRLYP